MIEFYLNDRLVQTTAAPEISALTLIREHLGLTGGKEVCAEGDCGACTIALGTLQDAAIVYQAVNSCILPAARLHGKHVITIEGLATGNNLHLLQAKMLEHHAVQCGYCTAGMVMSLFCLFSQNQAPTYETIVTALEGNLCRCTGYDAIRKAAHDFSKSLKNNDNLFAWFYPTYCKDMPQKLVLINAPQYYPNYRRPIDLPGLFKDMDEFRGKFKVLNGGTDLMVAANLHGILPEKIIDVSRIPELNFIRENNAYLSVGAAVTLQQVAQHPVVNAKFPVIPQVIATMGATQVRNLATIAGNLANASPIADTACALLALNAEVILISKNGERRVKLENFYHDYKVTAIDANSEIIGSIEIPIIANTKCQFVKSSKRKALDIATVNSAINLMQNSDGAITQCRIACGGVAKFPALARKASEFLMGKKLDASVINEAAAIAAKEFAPITDVRGSADYRNTLIHNHIIKILSDL